MRELKVYLRKEKVDEVVHALRERGIATVNVTHVRALGAGADPEHVRISFETGTTYSEVAKLEVVCTADEADALVPVIVETARTGEPGDGFVFVTPVDRAVKIRTGVEGRKALQ